MWNKVYPNVKLSLSDNQMLAFFHHWVNLEHLQIKVIIFKMGKGESKVKRTKIQNHKLKNNLKMKSNCIFLDCQKHQTEDRAKCVCDHVIASSVLRQCCLAGWLRGYFPLRVYLVPRLKTMLVVRFHIIFLLGWHRGLLEEFLGCSQVCAWGPFKCRVRFRVQLG